MLNVCARQWRSGWCLKLISGMPIACQAPIFFCLGVALISEYSGIPSQLLERQCHQERPALCFESIAKFVFKCPALYTFVMPNGGRKKSIGKALLLVGFLSYLGSHNLQTQAVRLGKSWTCIHLPSWWATSDTTLPTDRKTKLLAGAAQ